MIAVTFRQVTVAGSRAHPPRPAPGHPVAPLEPSAPSPPQCWACAPAKGEKRHAGRRVPGRGPGTGGPTTDVERLTGVRRPPTPLPRSGAGRPWHDHTVHPQPPSHRGLEPLSVGAHGRPTHERTEPRRRMRWSAGAGVPTEESVMADRYRTPDPQCRHARRGIVKAGDPTGAYASTQVCDRDECIADAKEWAEAQVRQPAVHVRDERTTSLFGAE